MGMVNAYDFGSDIIGMYDNSLGWTWSQYLYTFPMPYNP